jgi:acyl dehydratase
VRAEVGRVIGTSDWFAVTQDVVTRFAELTGDHEWIHLDVERSARGPFAGTIAHGYLTLSLIPRFAAQVFRLQLEAATLNYGLDRVRFPAPVLTGSRVRAEISVGSIDEHPSGATVAVHYVLEADGVSRPVCVADTVLLVLADS